MHRTPPTRTDDGRGAGDPTADALAAVGRGDRLAFSRLYSQMQAPLIRYAAALLAGDVDAGMDVVDEAFMAVWRDASHYDGAGSAEGWIRRIVRNKAVDWLRRRRERPLSYEAEQTMAETLPDEADTPDVVAEKASAAQDLRAALERLSPDHREVVWLCYFEEKPLSEIAELVGCPENTVKTRLFHARKLLRRELERA